MTSIAGPISFTKEAELVKEEKNNDEETWFVDWNPGFIFPELADGGDIGLETTPSARGEILDRNKMPLALNDTVREIRSEEHTSELQSRFDLVCRPLLDTDK